MKKELIIGFLAGFLLVTLYGYAKANTIEMNFSAANFSSITPTVPPVDPVIGSITWEAATTTSPIDNLISIDLSIYGHTYSLAEIAFENDLYGFGDYRIFYGSLNGYGVHSNTDDFWIRLNIADHTPFDFVYTVSGVQDIWDTQQFRNFSIEEIPIPEPATMFLLGTGLVGVAGAARRKKKNQA